jgi:hypothetical protein
MSRGERPDFLVAYNAVEVPPTIVSQDAIDEQVRLAEEIFFAAIQASLDLSPRTVGVFFEIERRLLVRQAHAEEGYFGTDDYQHRFRKSGQQILASVTYIRDDLNYQIAHFAKYPLLQGTEHGIRELQRLERIEFGIE